MKRKGFLVVGDGKMVEHDEVNVIGLDWIGLGTYLGIVCMYMID